MKFKFADYLSTPFANLANESQLLLMANSNTLTVNSIIVCNRSSTVIRFNLKKFRTSTNQVEIFYVNEFEIKPYQTIDILKELKVSIFLQYQENPSIIDSLVCFSNGAKQVFDCEIFYTRLNEAPYSLV